MDAGVLAQVLRDLPPIDDPNVLVGTSTADDAGVYRLSDELALVQTVDFFTPIVDDPRHFGRIAAANALSDVYAMGARPVSALAIAAFPEDLAPNILGEILRGGAEKAKEAGISVIGGHTVKDKEPKYGLAVTGVVHPDKIFRNDGGRAGDALVLTKPLGTGILTTARRKDAISEDALQEAIESMEMLNRVASEVMISCGARAATDITGFGFLGHLREMTGGTLGADIDSKAVPLLKCALELASEGCVPGGTRTNLQNARQSGVHFDGSVSEAMQLILADAQTSGGLLVAIDPHNVLTFIESLRAASIHGALVGQLREERTITVR
ncbi:MAG: selenide, water dikinase SelD [Candidatus Eremiobacteraeota bacterium]|nr:selenide, water dikinase SelD [Candidatus Eremiobacteraeota bacterium]